MKVEYENIDDNLSIVSITEETFYVDIPNSTVKYFIDPSIDYEKVPHPADTEWVNISKFDNREDALKFAQEMFGADEEGRICLVSS